MTECYRFAAVGDRRVAMLPRKLPRMERTEALVRVSASLVSTGTERHYIMEQRAGDPPLDLGYCVVGRVTAAGEALSALKPGDAVMGMGWGIAIHSNYVVVPRKLLCRVPQTVLDHHAALAALGATAIHAMDRADLISDDRVLVVGLGPVGQLACLAAADRGCQVWAWDIDRRNVFSEIFWKTLDLMHLEKDDDHAVTKIFLCVDADLTDLFPVLLSLLSPEGNGRSRSKIVNVGRANCRLALAPVHGNFDIVNVSRCGSGYRSEAYHHGLIALDPVAGEATVDVNLHRSMDLVARNTKNIDALQFNHIQIDDALLHYNSETFFPRGFCIIHHMHDHGRNMDYTS